jgi:hypothetical protein
MKKTQIYLILIFAGVVFFAAYMTIGKGGVLSRGFYTADYAEYGNTPDWYVASNTPLKSGTA